MGLFNKILGGQSSEATPLSPQEAFAGVLLVTIAADGHISDEEANSFNAIVSRMNLFKSQSGERFSAMVDKHRFKVCERSDHFSIYKVDTKLFGGGDKKLGQADSFEDALSLIKTSVSGPIRSIDID